MLTPRREWWIALTVAWLLVLARSFVYVFYEQAFFDSDQAVVGLMAKHLADGRAFPLFYYGQPYVLAVEAWMMAPWFVVFPASVALLHCSLVVTNLAIVTLIIVALCRWGQLRPLYALVAASFFAFAPPLTAAALVEANGANIEVFLFVLLLWFLRGRPLWFGAVLAIGVLSREFTIYAVAALVLIQAIDRTLFKKQTLRFWLLAAVMFFAVWNGIDAIKPFADLRGPGTHGQLLHGRFESQITNLSDRIDVTPSALPSRAIAMLADHLPRLVGAKGVDSAVARQGRDWMRWVLGLMATLMAIRIATRRWPPLGAYLLLVGLIAAAAYAATRPADGAVLRYYLLALFIPVGLVAIFLAVEPRASLRRLAIAGVCFWMFWSGVDHVRQVKRFANGEVPNQLRVLADALVAKNIRVAEAPYLRAYKLTFMTREQVKVAATDADRIEEYQRLATDAGDRLISIRESPCPGGERIADWYLCR